MGFYTLLLAELVGPGGRVTAFEAQPGMFDILGRNVELNGFQVLMDNDPNESHLRPTITVVDQQGKVVGFISHPEQIPEVKIVWG